MTCEERGREVRGGIRRRGRRMGDMVQQTMLQYNERTPESVL